MRIGVIGLGNMGTAIAKRLISAGHELRVYNRTTEKAEALLALGATLAHDPAGTADGDIVISMLSNDQAVEHVVFGSSDDDGGLIEHQGKRTVHISMSTISARLSRRIDVASAAEERPFISAPVMGRPDVASLGELIVMAAGDRRLIDAARPAFSAFARSVHVVGDRAEQANVAKLAANFMISSMIETFSEAFALVRKNDVDHHKFLEIMAREFFKSPVYEKYGSLIASDQFDTGAFTVSLQEKDTRLALHAAIDSQVPMPFAFALENLFLEAIGRGMGNLDPCSLGRLAAENAGLASAAKTRRR